MFELVADGDLRQSSQLSVRCLGTHPHSVDCVRLEAGDLGHRVGTNLDAQPALEVIVGVRAVVDAVAGHAVSWDGRRRIPGHYQCSRGRATQLNVRRRRDRRYQRQSVYLLTAAAASFANYDGHAVRSAEKCHGQSRQWPQQR